MSKKIAVIIIALGLLAFAAKQKLDAIKNLELAKAQVEKSLAFYKDVKQTPRSTNPDGKLKTVPSNEWTSGFYAGNLWFMYDYTKDKKWEQAARQWTAALEKEKFNTHTHDLGFMLYCSFGNGYRLTKDPAYKDILIQGAKSLST